jgi:hypothetical protein
MAHDERRASRRIRPGQNCYIAYIEGTGGIEDLSLGGAFVLDDEPLPAGEKIKFSLRDGTQAIPLHGVVTRSEAHRGMAIRFTDLSREDIRRLKIYISSLNAKAATEFKQHYIIKVPR